MAIRRSRGVILRLVRRRALAIGVGVGLAAPAAWLELGAHANAWWLDGLSLVLAATGIALVWAGVAGVKPDWVE